MGGRHPIYQATSDNPFKANDTYIADCSSFHIVTGPNMSGALLSPGGCGSMAGKSVGFAQVSSSCSNHRCVSRFAGKSTYLRQVRSPPAALLPTFCVASQVSQLGNNVLCWMVLQVALIVVMAHIGCFVPASFASIRCRRA